MAVIGTEEHTVGQCHAALLTGQVQGIGCPLQHVGQQGALGTLTGAAAHLFIVKQAVNLPQFGAFSGI